MMTDPDIKTSTLDVPILLECLKDHGITRTEIIQKCDFDPSDIDPSDFEISLTSLIKLWEFAEQVTKDPSIGINLRRQYGSGFFHFVNYIGLNSQNLFETLQNYNRYGKLFCSAFNYDLNTEGDNFKLSFSISSSLHQNHWIPEYHLSLPVYLVSMLDINGPKPVEVRFKHRCPTSIEAYQTFFQAPVLFEQEENASVFTKESLDFKTNKSNPHLLKILKQQAEAALVQLAGSDDLNRKVEDIIIKNLPTGQLDIEMAADYLHMHRTTLHRKLKENGTSFNLLLTHIRQNLAKYYLRQNMNIEQIAYLLGYSNRSGFQYAFKSWFKYTPGEFRRSLVDSNKNLPVGASITT